MNWRSKLGIQDSQAHPTQSLTPNFNHQNYHHSNSYNQKSKPVEPWPSNHLSKPEDPQGSNGAKKIYAHEPTQLNNKMHQHLQKSKSSQRFFGWNNIRYSQPETSSYGQRKTPIESQKLYQQMQKQVLQQRNEGPSRTNPEAKNFQTVGSNYLAQKRPTKEFDRFPALNLNLSKGPNFKKAYIHENESNVSIQQNSYTQKEYTLKKIQSQSSLQMNQNHHHFYHNHQHHPVEIGPLTNQKETIFSFKAPKIRKNQTKNEQTKKQEAFFSFKNHNQNKKNSQENSFQKTTENQKNLDSQKSTCQPSMGNYYQNYQRPSRAMPKLERQIKFEDFEIGKKMGKGQFGQVLLARHKATGFICGLKVMTKKVIREQNYINQIVRELSIQFYLSHRNIAPLYGYFSDKDNVYLIVEFCEGGQLLNRLKKVRRMEQSEVSAIIKEILQGLDYIHKQEIIHRDLKPQNILFNHDVVKISDFGWAVFQGGGGMRKTVSGSPLYYPPEIVKGEQYDAKIDLWNVGMMTYECILGKIPFRIYSELDLDKIVSDDITFPDYVDVTDEAQDFILKTMRKDANERMSIRQMLRHPFITKYCNSSEKSSQIQKAEEDYKILFGDPTRKSQSPKKTKSSIPTSIFAFNI